VRVNVAAQVIEDLSLSRCDHWSPPRGIAVQVEPTRLMLHIENVMTIFDQPAKYVKQIFPRPVENFS
jgi:hypothetical protein